MFRPDREPRGDDPLLLVKVTIFLAAAGLAFVGMALQRRWIIVAAIVLLAIAFLLRFARTRSNASGADASGADAEREDAPSPDEPPHDDTSPPGAAQR